MNREEILKKLEVYRKEGTFVPTDDMIKTDEQIEGIREAGRINSLVLDKVQNNIKAGITTNDIDKIVSDYTKELGGICAPLNFEGYPKSVCVSINDTVCHGIPSDNEIIQNGDIVSVDCTTIYNGYYGDACRTFMIGKVSDQAKKLVRVTKEALDKAFENIIPYKTYLGDIGYICNRIARNNGFSVVRELGGHGVGIDFHEDPFVSHVGKKGEGILLTPGMVFTIEPMINAKDRFVYLDADDNWTVFTADGSLSAQFEYTIAIFEDHTEILSK